jgi:hypothetical protein
MNETPASLAVKLAQHYREGRTQEALAVAEHAAARFPESPLAHVNHGFLLLAAERPNEARAAYERAVALDPTHAEGRRGLAVAVSRCGVPVRGESISIVPHAGPGNPVRVLVPLTLGSGNLVLDHLFDPAFVEVVKLALELHPADAGLPPHDVVFNAIGDADASPEALRALDALLRASNRRVLNAPANVARTGRVEQAARLRTLPGVRTPRIALVARAALSGLPLPMLLRAPGYHGGEHFELVRTPGELAAADAALPPGALFAIEFVNTRDAGGAFTKYRIVAVDGRLYPVHAAVARQWKVHYFSAEMATDPLSRRREEVFLADPRAALGAHAYDALERIIASVALEYVGIDFGIDAENNVVVFECNATMAVRRPPSDALWDYRRAPTEAALAAVTAMFTRYSSI